jgi:hypothetical protein
MHRQYTRAKHGDGRDSDGLEEMAAVLSMSHVIDPRYEEGFSRQATRHQQVDAVRGG